MIINKIKYNREFAFLTFSDELTIRIDAKVITAFALTEGMDFDREIIFAANYEYALTYGTDLAYKYLNYCARTEAQLAEHLASRNIQPDAASAICKKMKDYRYCDDTLYAESFVHSKIGESMGSRLIRSKLKQKGIDEQTAEAALSGYSPEQEREVLDALLSRLSERLNELPLRLRRDKLFARAVAKGFDAKSINAALEELALICSPDEEAEYFAPLIDREIARFRQKNLDPKAIYAKLYAKFVPKGANAALIRSRIEQNMGEHGEEYEE